MAGYKAARAALRSGAGFELTSARAILQLRAVASRAPVAVVARLGRNGESVSLFYVLIDASRSFADSTQSSVAFRKGLPPKKSASKFKQKMQRTRRARRSGRPWRSGLVRAVPCPKSINAANLRVLGCWAREGRSDGRRGSGSLGRSAHDGRSPPNPSQRLAVSALQVSNHRSERRQDVLLNEPRTK